MGKGRGGGARGCASAVERLGGSAFWSVEPLLLLFACNRAGWFCCGQDPIKTCRSTIAADRTLDRLLRRVSNRSRMMKAVASAYSFTLTYLLEMGLSEVAHPSSEEIHQVELLQTQKESGQHGGE